MDKKILAACLALCGNSSAGFAQITNTAAVVNSTTLRSDGHNFTNGSGGSYTVPNNASFIHNTPNYTFTNDGTYNATGAGPGGKDEFLASGTVTIAGSVAPVFGNMLFANRSTDTVSVTNTDGIRIARNLNWSGGGLILTPRTADAAASGGVVFEATGNHSNSSATQHINGYAGKIFSSGGFSFPVGDGTQLRPLTVSVQADDANLLVKTAFIAGDVTALDPTAAPPDFSSVQPGLASVSGIAGWDFASGNNANSIGVQISIPDMSGAGGYATAADMRLVAYDNTAAQWVMLGSSGAAGNTAGNTLSGTIAAGKADDYTALGIGSTNSWPLSLLLLSFSATLDASCRAEITWTTSHETSVKSFEVEYSADGRSYKTVGTVMAHNLGAYHFAFDGVQEGANHLRLKTANLDGSVEYSKVAPLHAHCAVHGIVAGPNPVSGELTVSGLSGESTIRIFTASGQLVLEQISHSASERINTAGWAGGSYILRVSTEGQEPVVQRLVKQ